MTPAGPPPELVHALQTRGYSIERALGEGGMGTVWLARSTDGEALAVKVPTGTDPRTLERFRREAEITRSLADVHGVVRGITGSLDAPRWLGLEYIPGETLRQRLERGPIEETALLGILAEVADTLAAAHQLGVVHRDLKGSNILLDERSGAARLADFGVARALAAESLTKTGELVGSVHTMAPEQISGERGAIGPAIDLWALGVLLYEGLSGLRPFEGETSAALAAAICSARPRPISELCERLRPATRGLIADCLKADPAKRLADAGVFAERCREALEQQPSAPPRSVIRPMLIAVAATALLAGLAFGLFAMHADRRRRLAARELREQAARLRTALRSERPRYEAWLTEEIQRAIAMKPPLDPFEASEDLARAHRVLELKLGEPPRTPDEDTLAKSRLWRLSTCLCEHNSDDSPAAESPVADRGSEDDRALYRRAALLRAIREGRLENAGSLVKAGSPEAERLAIHRRAVAAIDGLLAGADISTALSALERATENRSPPGRHGDFTKALWRALTKDRLARLRTPAEIIALSRRADRHAAALARLGGLEWSPEALAAIADGWLKELQERRRPPTPTECEELTRRLDRGPNRPPIDVPVKDRLGLLHMLTMNVSWPMESPGRTTFGLPSCSLDSIAARLCSIGLLIDPLFYNSPVDAPAPRWLKAGCHPRVARFLELSTDRLKGRLQLAELNTRKQSYIAKRRQEILELLEEPLPTAFEIELLVLLVYVETRLCLSGVSTEFHSPPRFDRLLALADQHPMPFRARGDFCWLNVALAVADGRLERRSKGLVIPSIDICDLADRDPKVRRAVEEIPAELCRVLAGYTAIDSPEAARRLLEGPDATPLIKELETLSGTIRNRVRIALLLHLELTLRAAGRVPGGLVGAFEFTNPTGNALETVDVTMDLVEREVYRARIAIRNGPPEDQVQSVSLEVPSVRILMRSILAQDRARAAGK